MTKNKSNLLNEAIADANAVREMALQNAEEVLKEQFQTRLQNLVSKSLQMEDDEEEDEERPEDEFDEYGNRIGERAPEEEEDEWIIWNQERDVEQR